MNKNLKIVAGIILVFGIFCTYSKAFAKNIVQLPNDLSNKLNPQITTEILPDSNNFKTEAAKSFNLNILTFNCWGVPKILFYEPTKDQKERFKNIVPVINGYDVVNLQETFSDNANIIIEGVDYPYKIRHNNTSLASYGSGLMSFSKYKIIKKGFKKFSQCAGADCFSNKGIFFMRIKVPQIGDLDIYNTHYQAIEDKEQIRISANKEFSDFLKENDVGNLTIMTGDFNFANYDSNDKSSKAYTDFIKRFDPIDTFRIKNLDLSGFTNDFHINNYVSKDDKPQRLDYIFILSANSNLTKKSKYNFEVLDSKVVFTQPVNGKFLSDHFGLTTTLKINLLD